MEPACTSKSSGREPGFSTGRPIQKPMVGGPEQRLAAIGAVEQHAEARPAGGDARGGLDREALERVDALARRAGLVGHLLELRAVVDGERHQRAALAAGASSPSGHG